MSCKKLDEFIRAASREEVSELAEYCGTSTDYLVHLARGYGNRSPSVALALSIERGTALACRANPSLPIVVCADFVDGVDVLSGGADDAIATGE